jgi:hypothetical protein
MEPATGEFAPAELPAMDQLKTRMRRHADGLLVLSGGSPGRGWPGPVPIGDLLGVVASEVGDVARVAVVAESQDEVTTAAAADVVQLIAELAEAAAHRTPPGGEVAVRAGRVGRGLAVEIEDRGAELDAAALEGVNALLATPPDFDLVETDQLGYVVAARLATKHRITVTLRSSPFGGTAAILVLPHAILVAGGDRDTIVDGSLPRIDVGPHQPELLSQPPGPQQAGSAAGLAERRVAPYVAADEDPGDAKPAPWYWLTASQPATPAAPRSRAARGGSEAAAEVRSAADQPTIEQASAGLGASAGGGTTAAGLPRRVRQASLTATPEGSGSQPADETQPAAE